MELVTMAAAESSPAVGATTYLDIHVVNVGPDSLQAGVAVVGVDELIHERVAEPGDGDEPSVLVLPEPGGLDQHLGALLEQELLVAGSGHVLAQRVRDVGVDVVLGGPGGVVGGGLLAVDGPPGEQRTLLAHLPGPLPGLVQHAVAEAQEVQGDPRLVVDQEGKHVDLGVPEVVPVVAAGRDRLGRDALLMGPR